MSSTRSVSVHSSRQTGVCRPATRTSVMTLGLFVAFAGLEHGVGALVQGPGRPSGLVYPSWGDVPAFSPLDGEPAASAYAALFPGTVLLAWWTGIDSAGLVAVLSGLAFLGLGATLVSAHVADRKAAGPTSTSREGS